MSEVRIVLQARLSSSRLPAKCLLPLGGMPLVVLSALRAANTGLSVVLATSSEQEDQILADAVEAAGIRCVRGSLEDVHSRFIKATEDMHDEDWVVRLTADNCFPDGAFIAGLIEQAKARKVEYLGTSSPLDGLPYGLSAEVFTVRALRSVLDGALTDHDREHVTPSIRKKYGPTLAEFDSGSRAQLRCTIDTRQDYFRLLRLFENVEAPLKISWEALCDRLAAQPQAAEFRIPWKQHSQGIVGTITLGTAQLGLEQYGRVNTEGRPSSDQAYQILDTAVRHGVTHIDSARAYGDSESRIGGDLRKGLYLDPSVITKLDPLVGLPEDASECEVQFAVRASVYESLHNLGLRQLPVLMLHRWAHRTSHGAMVWKALCALKEAGVIRQLGASVYRPDEALEALADSEITHLQIPCNLLDHRWRTEAYRAARVARPDVVVYGRSAYLQGILLSASEKWPQRDDYNIEALVQKLDALVKEFGRESRADLCIAYLQASSLVDTIVMGVETVAQLKENLLLGCRPALSSNEVQQVEEFFQDAPEWLLDPSQWT